MKNGKIKTDWELESGLELSEKQEGMEILSHTALKNVKVLSYILKHVAVEFKDIELDEIPKYIEVLGGDKEVSPGRTNMVKTEAGEFRIAGEKTSVFDILIKVRNPKLSYGTVKVYLHVDIEPQRDYRPREKEGLPVYPIEKRGIYYLTRSLSSQLPPIITVETNYAALEKCYSIWICRDNIPLEEKNSISFYEFKNTRNIGVDSQYIREEDFDLLSLVIIRLGSRDYEGENELIGFLNAFFYQHENKKESLSRYIDFQDDEEIKQEVSGMKGLGQAIYEDGIEDGTIKGRREAQNEMVISMYKNGISLERISKIAQISIEEAEKIVKLK